MFFTIFIAIFSIIVLIIIHELGHFIVAKKCGVRVEEFGIFLPPRLLSKKIGETVYSLNLIPFGAFVKLYGEEGDVKEARSFSGKPVWQRALIIVGGVVSFWLVGIILFTIIFSLGTFQAITDEEPGPLISPKVQIIAVSPSSPAEDVGLRVGDIIKEISAEQNQVSVDKVGQVQEFTKAHEGKEIILTIGRGEEVFEASLSPRIYPPKGEGAMGVALVRIDEISYSLPRAFLSGIETTFFLTQAIIFGLADILIGLVQGRSLPKEVQFVGPIGIGVLATQAVQAGASYFLRFIAIIAIYLAVFNLLPIPALDGGKLLFLGIEKIKGSPINQKIEQKITAGFFILFIFLMALVTIKDITGLL